MNTFIGQTFGKLTVTEVSGKSIRHETLYTCVCECGTEKTGVRKFNLTSGRIKSCGCAPRTSSIGEGEYHSNLHLRYNTIKTRCYQPSHTSYRYYGGKGIKVCDEWRHDYPAFAKWARANGFKEGLQIDRIDNNGDYSPENCRWVSVKQQANNKTSNVFITWRDETMTATQWAEDARTTVCYSTILRRAAKGETGDQIFGDSSLRKGDGRKPSVFVEINGETHTLKEWAEITNLPYGSLRRRYYKGDRGESLLRPIGCKKVQQ
jgi:hypothetical protein